MPRDKNTTAIAPVLPTGDIGFQIMAAGRSYTYALSQALAPRTGKKLPPRGALTVPRYLTLWTLARYPDGLTGVRLGEALQVTPQTMTTILAIMDRDGLIRRAPGKGRAIVCTMTRKGHAALKRGNAAVESVEAVLSGAVGVESRYDLSVALGRVHEVFATSPAGA